MGRFKPRELRNDASLDELRRQLNDIQKDIAADLTALSATRSPTEVQTGDYTARYGDVVRMAPPATGARLILPPVNLAQLNARVTLVLVGASGPVTVEAIGDATVNGVATLSFGARPRLVDFTLVADGWFAAEGRPGVWHVDDFGAVPQPLHESGTAVSEQQRTINTAAIQAAFDVAKANDGGTIYIGPGLYRTNGKVGYDLTVDINLPVIVQGLGGFTLIESNNYTEAVLQLRTTGGNIRDVVINDIVLRGGREGLAIFWLAYSRINRVWFWGSKNFALQNEFGNGNVFDECRFDESAQGISDGNEADAVLLISTEERFTGCNFGEFCGGILMANGVNVIQNSLFHDCKLRRGQYHSYFTDEDITLGGGDLLTRPASITLGGGYAVIANCTGDCVGRFILAFRGYELIVSGCRIQAVPGFVGFIDVWPDGEGELPALDLALNIAACTFQFNAQSGFLIQDEESSLHDAIVTVQAIILPGGAMTAFSVSAPALLNPGTENNLVQLSTFLR